MTKLLRKLTLVSILIIAACSNGTAVLALPSTLNNGSFEENSQGLPSGWHLDQKVAGKGSVQVKTGHPGAKGNVLQIKPNGKNSGSDLIGVGQMLDASVYRGKTLNISVKAGAKGNSEAIVGVHLLGGKGDLGYVQFRQGESGGKLVAHSDELKVDMGADNLIVYLIVQGKAGEAFFDSVKMETTAAKAPAAAAAAKPSGKALQASLSVDLSAVIRTLPPALFGTNAEWINDGQGLWSSKTKGLDSRGVELGKELGIELIRFPGGVFSDFYHWRDGLGSIDKRPMTLQYPNGNSSRHNFGILEADRYAKQTNADLLITVNAGTGTAQEAADWVKFMNKNGKRKNVTYWEVGNELYMEGDLSGAETTPREYAATYVEFARAMRAVDSDIKIGGIGGLNRGRYSFIADNSWTETLLKKAAGEMDFLAVHNGYAPVVMGTPDSVDGKSVYRAMLAAPVNVQKNLGDLDKLLKRYENPAKPITLAVTEWGPFFHALPSSPWVDHIKTLGSSLFVGSMLNTFMHDPRVEIATFFKLADTGFMGWMGKKNGRFEPTASYYAFQMYSTAVGKKVVQSSVKSPTFNAPSRGVVDAVKNAPFVDAVVVRGNDSVSLFIVNKHFTSPMETTISLEGVKSYSGMQQTVLSGTAVDAHTGTELPRIPGLSWAKQTSVERFGKGGSKEISLRTADLDTRGQQFQVALEPLSITRIDITGARFE